MFILVYYGGGNRFVTEDNATTYDLANSIIVVLPHTIIQIPATSNLS